MLAGVLLHVITAAFRIDAAMHRGARRRQICGSFQVMQDPAIFCIGDFGDAQTLRRAIDAGRGQPSGVVDLAAAGGLEGGIAKDDGGAGGGRTAFDNGIEFVGFGIVVVEAFGHDGRSR
jgi:hypothetical protein